MKKVMYLGERIGGWKKNAVQLFRDQKGKDYHYTGIKYVYFGSIYKMEAGDKMKREPEQAEVKGWEPTEAETNEYEAAKVAVSATRRMKRKVMELKRPHADIVKAVGLLTPFYWALDHFDRQAFIAWVNNACVKGALPRNSKKGKRR